MSFSIQTNVNSLVAQENLRVNSDFQGRTITRLTSGFRINQSGDDAAGLAIANKYRSDVAELTQGVRNANDGLSALQIIDGGMNNVGKMLDRLKTLATQSASDTFTGDRNVLNQEFQSLLSEIDRQAQGIGLDQNGQFAKSLSVFIGGGKTHGAGEVSIENGKVNVDLRSSAVDTQSLGLKGMQAVAGTQDIGTGSDTHTVAQILADPANTTATGGFSDFYFAGPGFSDGSKVKVSVNLSGVTDIDSLVTAINAAITGAGNGTSQAAAAFKNANIVASVHTDGSNGKQLAFTSSVSAFQVEAGDRMANGLMGNLTGTAGNALVATVTGAVTNAGTITPANVTLRISGGSLASAVDLTLDTGSTTTAAAITDLLGKVNNNALLQAAGIAVSNAGVGSAFAFTNSRGEKFSVQLTGDNEGLLGLGSFVAGSGAAADYTTIAGGAAYDNAVAFGTSHLEFSINGAASSANVVSLDLALGNATSAKAQGTIAGTIADQTCKTLIFTVDGGASRTVTIVGATTTIAAVVAQVNTQGAAWGMKATVDESGFMVITSNSKGAGSIVDITGGDGRAAMGMTIATNKGASRTAADLVVAMNDKFSLDPEMQKAGLSATQSGGTITIASSNGTHFRLNTGTSTSTANVGFGVLGAAFAASLTPGAANFSTSDSNGASNTTSLTFAALEYGNDDQAITISANDTAGALQSKSITLKNDATATRQGRTIDEAVAYINTQLQQSNNATLQKIVAVKENVGNAEKINFLSSLSTFNVSLGASINADGISGGTPASLSAGTLGAGANMKVDSKAGAQQAVSAVASAISTLGSAQAAVGKGQNQLGYALGLAQSQISSFAAAESRIRDADIASEAANLTKAQVLQQASIAAMAQANSAPQAVLSLLRG